MSLLNSIQGLNLISCLVTLQNLKQLLPLLGWMSFLDTVLRTVLDMKEQGERFIKKLHSEEALYLQTREMTLSLLMYFYVTRFSPNTEQVSLVFISPLQTCSQNISTRTPHGRQKPQSPTNGTRQNPGCFFGLSLFLSCPTLTSGLLTLPSCIF